MAFSRKMDSLFNKKEKEEIKVKDLEDESRFYTQTEKESWTALFFGKWEPSMFRSKEPMYVKFNCRDKNKYDDDPTERPKVKDVIFGNQFKLVLFEDGSLYSWGISSKG